MRGQFGAPSCRGRGLCLGIFCSAVPWAAHATDASGQSSHPTFFLYLALACFGFGGYLIARRTVGLVRSRRRRLNLMQRIPFPKAMTRSHAMFGWFQRRSAIERINRWEQRTRSAELKAEQALAVLRSELTPQLGQILRDRLIVTLISQRARLLGAQQANADKVMALEHRLTEVQKQVRQQSEAYEERIAQLERELQDKGAVTRELLRFRVLVARQALETIRLGPEPVHSSGR
jgi:hypothetical protein